MPQTTFRLKPWVFDVFNRIIDAFINFTDRIVTPRVKDILVEPAKMLIPDKELTPEEATDRFARFMSLWETKSTTPGGIPILKILLFTIGGALLIYNYLRSYFEPAFERYVHQPLKTKFRPELITVEDILEAHRRGIIPTIEERDYFLKLIGLRDRLIEVVDKLQWYIPTATDVIRFAVREVYTPEVVEKFRMREGEEEVWKVAETDFKKAAVDKETFQKYWRAHWELPSVTAGYEMYHRGIITMDELKMLMRALDIMPWWQDKLIQLAYAVYTRVDVRRMHKLGVLTDEELVRAYMDLGYDEEKAKKLAEFTIKYNFDPEEAEATEMDRDRREARRMTIKDVMDGYESGLLDETEARELLKKVDVRDEHIEFLIQRASYRVALDMHERALKVIRENYLLGIWDRRKTLEELNRLGLPARYTERLLTIWDMDKLIKPAKPSKTDYIDWLKKGLIDEKTFYDEMRALGFEDRYIKLYVDEIKLAKK